jgi:hypothetical protein
VHLGNVSNVWNANVAAGNAGYDFIDHTRGKTDNNFIQTNFGLRYAF